MQAQLPGGICLEYESFGAPEAPAILLIMGLGSQLVRWNIELCEALVAAGYRVIRFDNRDCGASSKMDGAPVPNIAQLIADLQAGRAGQDVLQALPYSLKDMARDCVALLDALAIPKAHLVGASMGGAIAQWMAGHFSERVLSLTCLMASSGNPQLPMPSPAAATALFAPQPKDRSRQSIVADRMQRTLAVSSPGYPTDPARLQTMLEAEFDRGFSPHGIARQMAAAIVSGDQRAMLRTIRVPTLVLHGADDPLLPVACGADIALNVPGARLCIIDGWGHDVPVALTERFVAEIVAIARTAEAAPAHA